MEMTNDDHQWAQGKLHEILFDPEFLAELAVLWHAQRAADEAWARQQRLNNPTPGKSPRRPPNASQ